MSQLTPDERKVLVSLMGKVQQSLPAIKAVAANPRLLKNPFAFLFISNPQPAASMAKE